MSQQSACVLPRRHFQRNKAPCDRQSLGSMCSQRFIFFTEAGLSYIYRGEILRQYMELLLHEKIAFKYVRVRIQPCV